jgi:hypothetical protein
MLNDEQLLAACPDYISIGSLLKANPVAEGGQRIVYFEASNEGLDQQDEVIAAKALADSSEYYLRYGNVDIDHFSMIGAKAGIPDYPMYEIGRPVDVRQTGKTTFVKAEIYSGSGPAAERANQFWSSITEINPPARWYPSVGGAVLEKSLVIDPASKQRKTIVKKVRWTNIGVSKTPVNQHVANCATMPVGAFAKCFSAASGGFDITKALEASYSTDVSTLTGGGALGRQSLDGSPRNYHDTRHRVSEALLTGKIKQPSMKQIMGYAQTQFGMSLDESAEFCERFLRDIHTNLKRSKS